MTISIIFINLVVVLVICTITRRTKGLILLLKTILCTSIEIALIILRSRIFVQSVHFVLREAKRVAGTIMSTHTYITAVAFVS